MPEIKDNLQKAYGNFFKKLYPQVVWSVKWKYSLWKITIKELLVRDSLQAVSLCWALVQKILSPA